MTLVDTGPLVALCDRRERRHAEALAEVTRLARAGLTICEAVMVEACFLLQERRYRLRLATLCDELSVNAVAPDDAAYRSDVLAWLLKYADHQPDWTDGALAVLSSRLPNARVWTFDREFRTTWRRLDGTAIPLATKV